MGLLSGDISGLVLRRTNRANLGEFSLDSHMLNVLVELDGERTIASVAKKVDLDMGAMKRVIIKLAKLRLVEPERSNISTLTREFFDYLSVQLSLAIGPIANVLIEEALTSLDYSKSRFPIHRAAELVELIARNIRREEKRIVFQQNMVKKIREMNT
jgi:hypothetical protein